MRGDQIALLGSDSFAERMEATRWLEKQKGTEPHLRRALFKGPSLEVGRRIELILQAIPRRKASVAVERLHALRREGLVDQIADMVAHWPAEWPEEGCWQEVYKLMRDILAKPGFPEAKLETLFTEMRPTASCSSRL